MSMIATLHQVLSSSLLTDKHLIIPAQGATDEQIALEETKLPRKLSHPHRRLLKEWNGLGLGVINFFGCFEPPKAKDISALCDHQSPLIQAAHPEKHHASILIAATPTGRRYGEDEVGHIFVFDKDDMKPVANNLDHFIDTYLFGENADQFGGRTWKNDLIEAGILDASLSRVKVRVD